MEQFQSGWIDVVSIPNINEKHLQLCLERDRVLCSPEFARSPVMSKLLKYLVEHILADDGTKLKAYVIAVDALERNDDFDPQTDSYPRVQIGRLRKMLDAFYAIEGGQSKLRIPLGAYEIKIVGNQDERAQAKIEYPTEQKLTEITDQMPQSRANTTPKLIALTAAVAVTLVGLFAAVFYWTTDFFSSSLPAKVEYPSLAIAEPNFVSTERDADAANRTMNVINEALSRFEGVDIHYSYSDKTSEADYELMTNVMYGPVTELNFKLINRKKGEIIWSKTVKERQNTAEMELALAKILIEVAGPYGAINEDQRGSLNGSMATGYPCLLQFDNYMRYRNENKLRLVLNCTKKTLTAYPGDAFVISKVAFANYIARQRKIDVSDDKRGPELARRAVEIDPRSANARFALARSEFFGGNCSSGRKWGYEAVELNPLDTRIMGYFSLYLNVCGDENAEAMATKALELDRDGDLIVPSNLVMIKLAKNDKQRAYEISRRFLTGAPRDEPSLLVAGAIAAAAVGRPKEAKTLWRKVTRILNIPENSKARAVLEKYIINKQLLNKMESAVQATNLAS